MNDVIVCKPLAVVIQDVAKRVNGGTIPSAITLVDTTLYLEGTPPASMRRHEAKHGEQWKRFRPWWMPLNPWRDRIAYSRFLVAYIAEHRAHGYENSRFEVEARAAEAG